MPSLHAAARVACARLPAIDQLPPCAKNGKRKFKNRGHLPEYGLFATVCDSCLRCLRDELELQQRVSPEAQSQSSGYTIRDFARWEVKGSNKEPVDLVKKDAAARVQAYLDEYWPHVPLNYPED